LRVAFAGTPEFAVPALRALAHSRHELVGVLTQPDRPRGRGRLIEPSAVKIAAAEYRLAVEQPATLKSAAAREVLAGWRADVLVVVAYGLILPQSILEVPRYGCLNIHASLLPRWRGAAPVQRAILSGDETTGITIMLMNEGLDTGPILLQRPARIEADDTAGTLEARLAVLGSEALLESLERWPAGNLVSREQPSDGASYAAKIDKREARLDWRVDALALERRVRALNPRPIAETLLDGEQLRIFRASVSSLPIGDPRSPGIVVAADESGITVQCGEGQLVLLQVQRAGRRPVTAREFTNSVQLVGRVLGEQSDGT
jgi:methionyl-tRNA formyltransferase